MARIEYNYSDNEYHNYWNGKVDINLFNKLTKNDGVIRQYNDGTLWIIYDDGSTQPLSDAVSVSYATKTSSGVIVLADNADIIAGVDDTKAVTPAGLELRLSTFTGTIGAATDITPGIVELATTAEVQSGIDTVRAITPATFKAALSSRVFSAFIGDGIATSFSILHNLNSDIVLVDVFDSVTDKRVSVDVTKTNNNTIFIGNFSVIPTSNQYSVNIFSPIS